jgi:CRP-like cAMP-binding protein
LRAISSAKLNKSIRKGEKLFSEGDPVQGVYFIRKGLLKVELNGKHGRPLIMQITGKGSIFGHRANQLHPQHSCSVTAVTDTQFCFLPSQWFHGIVEKSFVLKKNLLNQLLNELESAERKSVLLAHRTVREKIAEALLMLSGVYEYPTTHRSFSIHFCRQEIADLTGTTKEQVSKTLNDFAKEKLIKCRTKRFFYLDLNSLRSISLPPGTTTT